MHEKGQTELGYDDAGGIEITDASGSRSPNGHHCFSTHVGGDPVFMPDGSLNPALRIEVITAGSLLRHPNGAWQAANWHIRVRGIPDGSPVTNMRIRS